MSRAWVMEHTGASAATVARWYGQRAQAPEGLRFPEMACTIERVHYYDQEAVEAFWAAWREDVGTGRLRRAGRPRGDGKGNHGGGWGRARRDQAVATALEELKHAGGYQRGMATRLAREHGGNERSWQRAVAEARTLHEHKDSQSQNVQRDHDVKQEAGPAQTAP
ncbi:hypothetical protein ACIRPR_34185 [Streptomyces griseoflavus]|uniref:hypothetical protein n=1 Tax=Streptomyces griseoflavus TaxID=35619 RepID=UPI0037F1D9B3